MEGRFVMDYRLLFLAMVAVIIIVVSMVVGISIYILNYNHDDVTESGSNNE